MNEVDRISKALAYVPADDRETWLRMGMAIKSEVGEAGFDTWNEWSQQADSYNPRDAQNVWRSIAPDGAVTIGTLYYEAKAGGWSKGQPVGEEQRVKRQRVPNKPGATEQAEIDAERANTARKAALILEASTPAKANHPYLLRKEVSPVETVREIEAAAATSLLTYSPKSSDEPLTGRLLVVPVRQDDNISTVELIDESGRKTTLAGRGTKTGGYWATASLPDGEGKGVTLLIGEGVATSLSASQATGHPAVAALSSGNLLAVASAIRERFPYAELIVLADLEKKSREPDPNAIKAAQKAGARLAIPKFNSSEQTLTDFNDMMLTVGGKAVRSEITNACEIDKIWRQPQPLTTSYEPEPYPIDALPSIVRSAVEEVAGFVKAPLPMVASSALGALSLAIQAHVDVQRADKLHGPSGLFLLTIADSGERKSTCDGYFTEAIQKYEEEQHEEAKPILQRYRADFESWEAKRIGKKDKIRKESKDGKSTESLELALFSLEQEKPEPPRVARLMYADATPEALAHGLAKQWPSAGVLSAEAGIVFGSHGMGKDSVMRNLSMLNQLWDGKPLTIDRRTSESFTVRGARLTVALQVQEPTLREFFSKSGALARGTGFLARFLVAWPESTQGKRLYTEPPTAWPALESFNQRLAAILRQSIPIDDDGGLIPLMRPLSPEAKQAWIEYHDKIEAQLGKAGELYDVRDVASKSADNAARLAALFQMFEHGTGTVSIECFESASQITAWHLREARRFFGELALPAELADAVKVDGWLIDYCRRKGLDSVNKRYLRQHGPVRDGARLDGAIAELVQLDRLQLRKNGQRIDVAINPLLLELPA